MILVLTVLLAGLLLMIVLTAQVMMLPLLSACVVAVVVGIMWRTAEPAAAQQKYQALMIGLFVSQLVVLPFAWEKAKSQLLTVPPKATVQQDAAPIQQGTDKPSVEALAGGSTQNLDEFCKSYCADELGWSAAEFTKSSVQDFYQTSEPTDLRCDFSEVARDIGGDERHTGSWINEQCDVRGLKSCYWSINYGKPYGGRVACIRPAFVPRG